ncbi:Planctomycete cytochrome C [Caulifigura coniformis]|uniref:Planctomycete cytochrome C n=1 Tax=Caulifigura coniformis TaxID=2527983 RepID=A0A517S849_9PLAN|nr:DUF1592 domain-containing protein [Caulifigura coniformis]QDT52305.1 Planctomycete cytochrome C [Caulifigura coniformis]
MRCAFAILVFASCASVWADVPSIVKSSCVECHNADDKSGQLDLSALPLNPGDPRNAEVWVRIHDRVRNGEMPPKDAEPLKPADREALIRGVAEAITSAELAQTKAQGRATRRRLNRQEYENTLRDLLDAPWLQIRTVLPEDAIAHGYNRIGDALDVSHVQMARYLEAADLALNAVVVSSLEKPAPTVKRYYARDQSSFARKFNFTQFNTAPERATFPVLGFEGQPDVRRGDAPATVGEKDPAVRELEGVGLVHGAYEPVEPKFNRFDAPVSGRYKLRFMAHSVWVGPNGANANLKDPKKTYPKWFVPDLDHVEKGRRSEPVTIYSEMPPRQLRRLGDFDITPEPAVHEMEVDLLAGETIRPDASRLFRSRPGEGRWQNPLAEQDGQPGVCYRWLEVEGPLNETWPPRGHQLLFGDLPVSKSGKSVTVVSKDEAGDSRRLLARFAERAYRRPVAEEEKLRFLPVIERQLSEGASFKDAMIAGYTAILCSPEFTTCHAEPGKLDDFALASRLSYFLWNTEPDHELRELAERGELRNASTLRAQTKRLIGDARSRRFVESYLDYWLDLRKILDNNPDGALYGDYYLDDWLTDSALEETRLFFGEMLKANLPARTVAASDFTFVNERLAKHYGLEPMEGCEFRKVTLPEGCLRGGLLTQASILTVTANGTSTSPVVRGAWVMSRILGKPPAKPPAVPAVEPDLRGATTIREQLAKHRDQASCAACHKDIDPPGFALESFDVAGGFRTKYRAQAAKKEDRVAGFAKSGQAFQFQEGLPVDSSGQLAGGEAFRDIQEFKMLLLADERQLARNLVNQLAVYATGAPIRFSDRAVVETILDQTQANGYRTADVIHALVQSSLFREK